MLPLRPLVAPLVEGVALPPRPRLLRKLALLGALLAVRIEPFYTYRTEVLYKWKMEW